MKRFRKCAGCLFLSIMLAFSLAACGKGEVIVDDYGSDGTQNSVAGTDASSGDADSLKVVQGSGQPLRDVYGDRVSWEESLVAGDKTVSVTASYTIPDVPGMNVYRSRLVGDGKNEEEKIVKALFGDTGKKIDEFKITNETDYITMAYKYRKVMSNRNMITASIENEGETISISDINDQYRLISPDSVETYKWIDEDDIFIHMYEGDYQGIKYGLLLAYDIYTKQRIIFFDPVSIKAYYPDKEYKSLYIEGSNDSTSEPIEIENACTKSVEQVKEEASKFLKDKLNISSSINKITTDSTSYNFMGDNIAGFEFSSYEYKDEGASVLAFTDSDYLSAIISGGHGGKGAGYQVLALQQDLFTESGEEDIYMYISRHKYDDEASKEEVNFDVDGYAVYLESSIHSLNQDLKDPQNMTFSFSFLIICLIILIGCLTPKSPLT